MSFAPGCISVRERAQHVEAMEKELEPKAVAKSSGGGQDERTL